MKFKLLISDNLAKEGIDVLSKEKNIDVHVKTGLSNTELKKIIKDYDALIVRSATRVTKDIIKSAKKLKVIGRAGVGLDNIDVDAASKKGIIVMNAPAGNTISTAEHAFSLLVSLARNIPQANQSMKSGKWEKKKFLGVELYGKVLGIVGLGRIGTEIAKRAQSFGMKVIAFDPFLTKEKAMSLAIESVNFQTLLTQSDFITIHTPLTSETIHLFGKKEFLKMKKSARIVNAARGGIIDENALLEAVEKGEIAGAALDVFEKEPPENRRLVENPGIITTPHLGASTEEAQINVAIDIAKCIKDALYERGLRNAVNVPSLDMELLNAIKPYINLAEKLGAMLAQLIEGAIKKVTIKYTGDIAKQELAPVTRAFIKGMLSPILEETVNYVNSIFIAKERGISIIEKKTASIEDFATLISAEVDSGKKKSFVMGTLFTNNEPRIVKINQFYVEAVPEGYMLVISNKDIPGIVGQIGTILGKAKINIAGMSFGRNRPKGQAISLLNIDAGVPPKVMERIKKVKNIYSVKQIKL